LESPDGLSAIPESQVFTPCQDKALRSLPSEMTEEEIAVKFTALGGDVIGKDQCKKLQSFIMSLETAKNLGGLFELTTVRDAD
jgi:hypothetical protein